MIISFRADKSKAAQVTFSATVNAGGTNTRWYLIYSTSPTLVTGEPDYPLPAPGTTQVEMTPFA
ncbi:MAG: hypothetical protein ACKOCY_03440, partial [Actinomycetota bacterium]